MKSRLVIIYKNWERGQEFAVCAAHAAAWFTSAASIVPFILSCSSRGQLFILDMRRVDQHSQGDATYSVQQSPDASSRASATKLVSADGPCAVCSALPPQTSHKCAEHCNDNHATLICRVNRQIAERGQRVSSFRHSRTDTHSSNDETFCQLDIFHRKWEHDATQASASAIDYALMKPRSIYSTTHVVRYPLISNKLLNDGNKKTLETASNKRWIKLGFYLHEISVEAITTGD